jgi:hypothetical protein
MLPTKTCQSPLVLGEKASAEGRMRRGARRKPSVVIQLMVYSTFGVVAVAVLIAAALVLHLHL